MILENTISFFIDYLKASRYSPENKFTLNSLKDLITKILVDPRLQYSIESANDRVCFLHTFIKPLEQGITAKDYQDDNYWDTQEFYNLFEQVFDSKDGHSNNIITSLALDTAMTFLLKFIKSRYKADKKSNVDELFNEKWVLAYLMRQFDPRLLHKRKWPSHNIQKFVVANLYASHKKVSSEIPNWPHELLKCVLRVCSSEELCETYQKFSWIGGQKWSVEWLLQALEINSRDDLNFIMLFLNHTSSGEVEQIIQHLHVTEQEGRALDQTRLAKLFAHNCSDSSNAINQAILNVWCSQSDSIDQIRERLIFAQKAGCSTQQITRVSISGAKLLIDGN